MITIADFLADPSGPDTGAEYITIANSGAAAVSLAGWELRDKSGKSFSLSGYEIPAGKKLRLFSSATKITLNNNGEEVLLFNAEGELVDRLSQGVKAIEGVAFVRGASARLGGGGGLFDDIATTSLPGVAHSSGAPLGVWIFFAPLLALAAVLIIRTLKSHGWFEDKHRGFGPNG